MINYKKTIISIITLSSFLLGINLLGSSATKISLITASDLHTPGYKEKSNDAIGSKMKIRDLVKMMTEQINDKSKNIQGIIFIGDSAGGYGNEDETKGFLEYVYKPLAKVLPQKQIFLIPGNHDTYDGKMLKQIKSKYGDYMFQAKIGPIELLSLGLYPSSTKKQSDKLTTKEPSLDFLKKQLKRIGPEKPVLIAFHFYFSEPCKDCWWNDWWPDKDRKAFIDTIKNYNVVGILVGHVHGESVETYKGFKVIRSAGEHRFAVLTWDPAKPRDIKVKLKS